MKRFLPPYLSLYTVIVLMQHSFAANPELVITHNQAQQFFGNRAAKMILHYPGDYAELRWDATGEMGPLYLIDFAKKPLRLEKLSDSAQSFVGDPFISPDGTRYTFNQRGKIFVAYLRPSAPPPVHVADGFEQRWWVHPESGEEYLIFVSHTPGGGAGVSNSTPIRPEYKTYIVHLQKGTCQPAEDPNILLDGILMMGGRTPDGSMMYTAQPGDHLIKLTDSLAVDQTEWTVIATRSMGQCNPSVSIDPEHPTWFFCAPFGHRYISYGPDGPNHTNPHSVNDGDGGYIAIPEDYSYCQWQEWSTHPDFVVASPTAYHDDWNTPSIHDACVYQWSTNSWIKVASHSRSTHLWVGDCKDPTPPPAPEEIDGTAQKNGTVHIRWNSVTDSDCYGIPKYIVERVCDDGTINPAGEAYDTSFIDKNVSSERCIKYRIRAFNSNLVPSLPSDTIEICTGPDTIPPTLTSVEALGKTTIKVQFDEAIGSLSGLQKSNYAISNNINIDSVTLDDSRTTLLHVSPLRDSTEYEVTVNNIEDTSPQKNRIETSQQMKCMYLSATSGLAIPQLTPVSAFFSSSQPVYINHDDSLVTIRYTTNGKEPNENSPVYTGNPVVLTTTTIVMARAYRVHYPPSKVAVGVYRLQSLGAIVYPKEDDTLPVGTTDTLRFESFDTTKFNSAVVQITINGGRTWHVITNSAVKPDSGTTTFNVPWEIPSHLGDEPLCGKNALVKISQYGGNEIDKSDKTFSFIGCNSTNNGIIGSAIPVRPKIIASTYGKIKIVFPGKGTYRFHVFDMKGRMIKNGIVEAPAERFIALPSTGVYIIRIHDTTGSVSKRIVNASYRLPTIR